MVSQCRQQERCDEPSSLSPQAIEQKHFICGYALCLQRRPIFSTFLDETDEVIVLKRLYRLPNLARKRQRKERTHIPSQSLHACHRIVLGGIEHGGKVEDDKINKLLFLGGCWRPSHIGTRIENTNQVRTPEEFLPDFPMVRGEG